MEGDGNQDIDGLLQTPQPLAIGPIRSFNPTESGASPDQPPPATVPAFEAPVNQFNHTQNVRATGERPNHGLARQSVGDADPVSPRNEQRHIDGVVKVHIENGKEKWSIFFGFENDQTLKLLNCSNGLFCLNYLICRNR